MRLSLRSTASCNVLPVLVRFDSVLMTDARRSATDELAATTDTDNP
jgi:hypothetical protein